ncbi:MAG: DUF3656 domain-containing protein, partial [Oscillospiraceae bacterium]|nr:DUF3656 domain-containing protein [Oscillospiraceae bacterium]
RGVYETVLSELAALYEKPRMAAVLDFSLQLRADSPAVLTVSDDSGLTAVIEGEVPETAKKNPLSADMLRRSMQKLGGTVYACGEVNVDNPDGLILSAAQCNALRRSAIDQMDSLRIARNTPVYTVSEDVLNHQPGQRLTWDIVSYRLHVRTVGQLAQALTTDAIVCVPPQLAANCTPSQSVYVEAPRILQEEAYTAQLKKLRDCGFSHLVCHNLADIAIGKKLGFTLHGGFGLNITNRLTVQELEEMGVCDMTGSAELQMGSLCRLADDRMPPIGAVVYGRLPMMLFRVCPIKAQDGCRKHDCFLTDRTGRQFPLLCSGHYQELVNCNVLWLERKDIGRLDYQELYFTDETPARLLEVLDAYKNGGTSPANRTSGLYKKGGLR